MWQRCSRTIVGESRRLKEHEEIQGRIESHGEGLKELQDECLAAMEGKMDRNAGENRKKLNRSREYNCKRKKVNSEIKYTEPHIVYK